mmetsp:Transcript_6175/g.16814  ORF Transcript_6175/g.16814 Transcript_6175/m.16814 type:complete len:289 (-) Transcript_6175:1410-2276(-)
MFQVAVSPYSRCFLEGEEFLRTCLPHTLQAGEVVQKQVPGLISQAAHHNELMLADRHTRQNLRPGLVNHHLITLKGTIVAGEGEVLTPVLQAPPWQCHAEHRGVTILAAIVVEGAGVNTGPMPAAVHDGSLHTIGNEEAFLGNAGEVGPPRPVEDHVDAAAQGPLVSGAASLDELLQRPLAQEPCTDSASSAPACSNGLREQRVAHVRRQRAGLKGAGAAALWPGHLREGLLAVVRVSGLALLRGSLCAQTPKARALTEDGWAQLAGRARGVTGEAAPLAPACHQSAV